MGGWSSGLVPVVLLASLTGAAAFSKNFVNSSLPDSKFTFVVNFDSSQVICQHSENASDLFIHEMSILCDGKQDCFTNPAIHDESFPYCEQKCLSNCNNRGACLFDGRQPQCFCNSGFSGPSCEFVDKNECLANPCHMMADCKNRPFGFDCECRSGFVGNGYNCADIDECSSENDCPLNSVCVNLPGTHYCNCTQGFAQKGDALITNCVDINECETGSHNCGKNQLCENTIGGFKCVSGCTDGYEYSNGECIDIDECKKEEICHPRAECFNSPGNYSCICEEGMEGDGKFCQPKTDCTQREDICDRHAQCIHPLKMCQCMAGFAGDGISCHDVDECQAMSEPCKQQKGKRCVNIVGGFICCDKGSDDERCIEEKGAFCAGGCGLNAYCGNRTCECLPGYSGDPFKKCLDVNECDMDSMCSGVGEWCVNIFGSFLCCKPDSTEPECQGVHIFRNSDGSAAILHTNHTKDVVVSGEQGEHGITHQGGFIAVGKGVLRANGSLPSISALSKRACTSYCPINSECVNGYCECSKGFGGNPHLGCEDLNECIATKPCGEETKDNWCVNTEGSFTCCTSNSTESECLGLEIVPEEGMRIFGGRSSLDGEQLIAQSVNETVSQEVVSHRIQEFQNASQGGAVLLVRNAVPTDIAILKPEKGEMGLEITGEQVRKESIGSESTTQTPEETVTLPGIISTLGGLSTSTTAIPVTEVPIHIPGEKKTHVPKSNETTTVLIDASTLKSITELEGSGSEISKTPSVEDGDMLPGGSTTESSQTSSGHINVRFTTLEELNKNATKTTVGPNTIIDGDGRGEESTVDGKGGKKPANVIDGDGTGDVNVVDTRVRTTKAPTPEEKLKEPNPDKEGLEIVAKATKPITDVTTPKPDATKTTEETTQKTTSIPTKKLTEQLTEATKGEATSKPTEGETSTIGKLPEGATSAGKETTVKTSTISSSGKETTPLPAEKTTSTNAITGPDSASSSKTNVEETSGKSGSDKPDLAEDSREKEEEEKNDKKPTKTVISDREEPGKGKHLTELSSGEQKAPETDRHGGDSEDSAQGEVGTHPPTTTEATTGETGLEIVHRGTGLPDTTTTSSGTEGTTKSSTETSSSSAGGSVLVAKEKKNDSGSKRPETDITDGENSESFEGQSGIPKTTAEPITDGVGHEIKWEGTTLFSSSLPTNKPSTIETATGSTAGLSEKSTEATSVGLTASTGTSLATSEPTTGSSKAPESETTSVGTTREGHINISIGPTAEPTEATTESGTAETGLEIIHEATEAGTSEAATPSSTHGTSTEKPTESTASLSSEKTTEATSTTVSIEASSLGTSEPTGSSTSSLSSSAPTDFTSTSPEATTSEVGLEIVGAITPSSSSVSTEDKTEAPTTQPAKEDTTTGTPTTTELGLEIVPDKATTKAAEEATTGQPDLALTGAPSSSVEPSSFTSSSTEAPVTAAGRIENVTRSTEVTTTQPDLVLTVSSTAEASTTEKVTTTESTVKPTEEITAAPTLPTDGTTKTPKTTVEVVTAGPDEDLTGAPTKQNRLIPTDLPSEPEVTTKETFSLPEKATPSPVTLGPNNVTKCVSSDECGGDALCERRTGACRCLPGFQGIPPATPCTDVDECAEGLHKCHESARCHNIVGTYACFCPMGYRKNELGVCIDIDECSESRGNCCSLNGTCVNKPGSYGCECKPGFFGDGYKCMPMEKRICTESELAKAGCGQHHVCMVDGLGAVDCNTCKMGFKMVEGKCSDVNECTEPGLSMCSPSANCNNLLGTYACSCKEGFKGDGYMCEDVDECSNSPCHPQAECENLLGSFKCTCPSGFTGDGIKDCMNPLEKSCEDVAGFCGRVEHTACLSVRIFNGSLSSVCECEPGFRFNKQLNKCDDINECEENRHNCDPASSVCVNEAGGFHCDCAEGYEGVGGICVDVNECERGTAGCHSMAMCLNQPGSCGCKCMQGFTGDGIQCNPLQKREEENACTAEWDRLCLLENKTCHVDEEDVPQCGSCIEGHHPIKGSCQPVHGAGTCADPNKNSCDKNAECIDIPGTPGKHFCTCKKGFIGDGIRCDDIDECSLTGICHLHATCQNLPGSFNCTCNPDFTGNGFTCTKTAGPNCHLNEELCHKNAECTMDGQCKCKKGFEGDGFKECTEISGTTTQREETATGKTITTISSTTETGSSTTSMSTPSGRGAIVEEEKPEEVELVTGSVRVNFTGVSKTPSQPSSTTQPSPTEGPSPPSPITTRVPLVTKLSGTDNTAPVTSTTIQSVITSSSSDQHTSLTTTLSVITGTSQTPPLTDFVSTEKTTPGSIVTKLIAKQETATSPSILSSTEKTIRTPENRSSSAPEDIPKTTETSTEASTETTSVVTSTKSSSSTKESTIVKQSSIPEAEEITTSSTIKIIIPEAEETELTVKSTLPETEGMKTTEGPEKLTTTESLTEELLTGAETTGKSTTSESESEGSGSESTTVSLARTITSKQESSTESSTTLLSTSMEPNMSSAISESVSSIQTTGGPTTVEEGSGSSEATTQSISSTTGEITSTTEKMTFSSEKTPLETVTSSIGSSTTLKTVETVSLESTSSPLAEGSGLGPTEKTTKESPKEIVSTTGAIVKTTESSPKATEPQIPESTMEVIWSEEMPTTIEKILSTEEPIVPSENTKVVTTLKIIMEGSGETAEPSSTKTTETVEPSTLSTSEKTSTTEPSSSTKVPTTEKEVTFETTEAVKLTSVEKSSISVVSSTTETTKVFRSTEASSTAEETSSQSTIKIAESTKAFVTTDEQVSFTSKPSTVKNIVTIMKTTEVPSITTTSKIESTTSKSFQSISEETSSVSLTIEPNGTTQLEEASTEPTTSKSVNVDAGSTKSESPSSTTSLPETPRSTSSGSAVETTTSPESSVSANQSTTQISSTSSIQNTTEASLPSSSSIPTESSTIEVTSLKEATTSAVLSTESTTAQISSEVSSTSSLGSSAVFKTTESGSSTRSVEPSEPTTPQSSTFTPLSEPSTIPEKVFASTESTTTTPQPNRSSSLATSTSIESSSVESTTVTPEEKKSSVVTTITSSTEPITLDFVSSTEASSTVEETKSQSTTKITETTHLFSEMPENSGENLESSVETTVSPTTSRGITTMKVISKTEAAIQPFKTSSTSTEATTHATEQTTKPSSESTSSIAFIEIQTFEVPTTISLESSTFTSTNPASLETTESISAITNKFKKLEPDLPTKTSTTGSPETTTEPAITSMPEGRKTTEARELSGSSTTLSSTSRISSSSSTAKETTEKRLSQTTTIGLTQPELTISGLTIEVTSSVSPSVTTITTDQPSSTLFVSSTQPTKSTSLFSSNGNKAHNVTLIPDSFDSSSAAPPSMTPPNFETTEIVPTTEPEMYGSTTQESTESTTVLTTGENSTEDNESSSTISHGTFAPDTPTQSTFETTRMEEIMGLEIMNPKIRVTTDGTSEESTTTMEDIMGIEIMNPKSQAEETTKIPETTRLDERINSNGETTFQSFTNEVRNSTTGSFVSNLGITESSFKSTGEDIETTISPKASSTAVSSQKSTDSKTSTSAVSSSTMISAEPSKLTSEEIWSEELESTTDSTSLTTVEISFSKSSEVLTTLVDQEVFSFTRKSNKEGSGIDQTTEPSLKTTTILDENSKEGEDLIKPTASTLTEDEKSSNPPSEETTSNPLGVKSSTSDLTTFSVTSTSIEGEDRVVSTTETPKKEISTVAEETTVHSLTSDQSSETSTTNGPKSLVGVTQEITVSPTSGLGRDEFPVSATHQPSKNTTSVQSSSLPLVSLETTSEGIPTTISSAQIRTTEKAQQNLIAIEEDGRERTSAEITERSTVPSIAQREIFENKTYSLKKEDMSSPSLSELEATTVADLTSMEHEVQVITMTVPPVKMNQTPSIGDSKTSDVTLSTDSFSTTTFSTTISAESTSSNEKTTVPTSKEKVESRSTQSSSSISSESPRTVETTATIFTTKALENISAMTTQITASLNSQTSTVSSTSSVEETTLEVRATKTENGNSTIKETQILSENITSVRSNSLPSVSFKTKPEGISTTIASNVQTSTTGSVELTSTAKGSTKVITEATSTSNSTTHSTIKETSPTSPRRVEETKTTNASSTTNTAHSRLIWKLITPKTPFPLEIFSQAPLSTTVSTEPPLSTSSHSPEAIDSNGAYFPAPSIVTDDGVEVHTETNGPKPVGSQRQEKGKCSADDRSKCHEFAICDLSTKSCRCKDGFKGDGFTSCTQVISVDCVSNSSLCHSDAFCDRHTRKCACNSGYIGDGILCSPDPQDCILRKDLCSPDAICSGRRCHCVEGFTGDGVKCVSLHQRSANCSECDINAHCSQGVCSCNIGYFGNGLCCVPDPRDCIHFPGVCHPEASCNKESRQCSCKRGYLGDGISCFPAVSCVTDPSVCNKNAVCLPSGHCMCRNGYEGNGHNCQLLSSAGINAIREMARDTPSLCGNKCNRESELCIEGQCICKHGYKKVNDVCQDIDECAKSPCHPLAACHNTKGSFSCTCPEGYVGDGRTCVQHLKIGELGVFCENDGMTLVLSNETQLFEGKMYVRGQAENPNCIKTFSPLQQQPRPYTFKVFFEHCNVQLLENNTFATTVIVQKHPHFITTSADSYDLKCTYSPGISQVQSHVNVSELAPTSTLSNKFDGPTCSLKITDDHDDFVESAKVGQSMVLRLEVSPNGTYGILPRDCVAVNIETGERYQLTDKYGCAVDNQLFPEFTQIHPSITQAVFRTFKWPDSSMIRFQCDCNACIGPCPVPDCHHKRTLPRFRRAHHGEKEIDQEVENLNLVETNRKAFSRLLTVHEDVQEQLAQEEIEQWHRRKSHLTESLPAISEIESEGVCVRTAILAGAALLLVLSLGFLTTTFLQRRSKIPKSPDSPISVISL